MPPLLRVLSALGDACTGDFSSGRRSAQTRTEIGMQSTDFSSGKPRDRCSLEGPTEMPRGGRAHYESF